MAISDPSPSRTYGCKRGVSALFGGVPWWKRDGKIDGLHSVPEAMASGCGAGSVEAEVMRMVLTDAEKKV